MGDQRALEQELWQTHGIRCEFATFAELTPPHLFLSYKSETLDDSVALNRSSVAVDAKLPPTLFFRRHETAPCFEISLVYFRAGYTPSDYPESASEGNSDLAGVVAADNDVSSAENEHVRRFRLFCDTEKNTLWRVRGLIEFSRAIKCPSVGLHLAGVKAIQAALTRPGVVETLLLSPRMSDEEKTHMCRDIDALRLSFAEQHLLSFASTSGVSSSASVSVSSAMTTQQMAAKDAVKDACDTNGLRWVLKPQREGGGNNLYGDKIATHLRRHRDDGVLQGTTHVTVHQFHFSLSL